MARNFGSPSSLVRDFDNSYRVDAETDCFVWHRTKLRNRGRLRVGNRQLMAHRFAWERINGIIPIGMVVCHRCDNPSCVNPDHLFLGTQAENMRDMVNKNRSAKGSRHSQSKLEESDIPRIRDMLRCGAKQSDIGAWFGVSRRSISDIGAGKTWGHC